MLKYIRLVFKARVYITQSSHTELNSTGRKLSYFYAGGRVLTKSGVVKKCADPVTVKIMKLLTKLLIF